MNAIEPPEAAAGGRSKVPARRRRWGYYLPALALIFILAGPGLRGTPSEMFVNFMFIVVGVPVFVLVIGIPFGAAQRHLYSILHNANPSLSFVIIRLSPALASEIKDISGISIGYPTPMNASLAFVDAGSRFELWRLRRGGPERVLRIPWSNVSSVEIATVTHRESIERAVEVKGSLDGRAFQIGLPPQRRGDWLFRPQGDKDFDAFFHSVRTSRNLSRDAGHPHPMGDSAT
ncbi:hypothetical protein QN345_16170 [Cryobacterium sp. 10I1]|uniref:hypothetical protein n=1 Tax=unclassified Cryobacterium TaxID=2649013 RepID=UPI002AC8C7A2|nr:MULTISPECIES: hypothetical protein [unclassified Cryobacterium]MEB0286874.1 hypothetical protein [Cryobacterium sp. 10S3]MEB0306837.1 hypothetical protein [Cryobacterium sp. 10I1]WPX13444.1 hypothetical protein RHM57_17525 [Cryobacterium sp. 10S3]